jgi:hypothetical protein
MPRPKKINRSVDVHLMLSESLVAEVDMMLFSPLQQRVPMGARAEFYERAARAELARLRQAQLQLALKEQGNDNL